jgi:microcystin-dependent protein
MATPFIGEIVLFGGNFAIRGTAFCNGQLLSIQQNSALFSLLGTTYGGDGVNSFGLPDMRGRLPVHQGQLAGGSLYTLGQVAGSETVTLIAQQLPSHTHDASASSANGTTSAPANQFWAADPSGNVAPYSNAAANGTFAPAAISNTGGSQPHPNVQPFLCINFLIALEGVFPSRN